MHTIAICEQDQGRWQVERDGAVLHEPVSQEAALKWALGEADRSFARGERVQVIVAPSSWV